MKVLWFSNTLASAEEYLNQQSKGTGGWMKSLDNVLQNEVELAVAFLYPYPIAPFKYKRTMYYPVNTGNIIVENLKRSWLHKIYDTDFLFKYLDVIEKVKPDIIHIHGSENSFLCIIDHVNTPVVISIQGNLTVYSHKFLSGLSKDKIRITNSNFKLKSLLFGSSNFYRSLKLLEKMAAIEQRSLMPAKYIIGRTDWDKRITRILAPKSVYFQGEEMLRDSFYGKEWKPIRSNKLIIHTTNGNSPYKGFEALCHTLHLLNELNIEIEWRVAGISERDLIVKIVKKQLGKKYPQKGLILLGGLNEAELANRLLEANMYVMPSHIENSPNNLCEAMILGMPCIATFAGGTGSMLKDAEEGILVQDGDPWAMAGAIIELKNDSEKASKYGKAARDRALIRHDKNKIIENLISTYQTIINK